MSESNGPPSVFSTASRKKKLFTSALIYYGLFTQGIALTSLNPSMLDFARKFGIESDELSIVFTVGTASGLFGALLGGILLNFVNRQLFIIGSFVLMTGGYFAMPFSESKTELCVFAGIVGAGVGSFDCAQIAWVIDIWRHEAPPYIITEHFAFSVGTLVTPLILGPYLTDEIDEEPETPGETTRLPISSSSSAPFESRLTTPFMIGGALLGLSLAMQVVLYFVYRKAPFNEGELRKMNEDFKRKASVESATKSQLMPQDSLKRRIVLVILTVGACAFYAGLELSTGNFLPIFAHYSPVKFTDAEGARLSFAMQCGFAGVRFVGIFIVLKIAPHFIIVTSMAVLLAANTILLAAGGSDATWLWVGAVAFGVGEACVYPALFAYVEKYLFITNNISAIIVLTGGLTSAAYPLIIGDSIKENPAIMPYVNFCSLAVSFGSFAILFWITFVRERRLKKKEELQISET